MFHLPPFFKLLPVSPNIYLCNVCRTPLKSQTYILDSFAMLVYDKRQDICSNSTVLEMWPFDVLMNANAANLIKVGVDVPHELPAMMAIVE